MIDNTNVVLDIKNISKKFDDFEACKNIRFQVFSGEFLSIVGESGSGKSTLIKMLSNLEIADTGEILHQNQDLTKLTQKKIIATRKEIQLVFQDTSSSLNPKMKVKHIICEPLLNFKMISKKEICSNASELLYKVGLDESFLNKKPNEMSGGQKQRVNIARALSLKPKILLLDEPTSALDVITQNKIIELLKSLQKDINLTIVFICHDIALVSNISNRIIVMKNGEIKEILGEADLHLLNRNKLDIYTQELLQATFDIKKCECRFEDYCVHEPDFSL